MVEGFDIAVDCSEWLWLLDAVVVVLVVVVVVVVAPGIGFAAVLIRGVGTEGLVDLLSVGFVLVVVRLIAFY